MRRSRIRIQHILSISVVLIIIIITTIPHIYYSSQVLTYTYTWLAQTLIYTLHYTTAPGTHI